MVKNKPRSKEGGKNGYGLERRYHWIEAVISTKVTRLLSYQQDQLQLEKMAIESELVAQLLCSSEVQFWFCYISTGSFWSHYIETNFHFFVTGLQ